MGRVLVVDPDDAFRKHCEEVLQADGYELLQARNAAEAASFLIGDSVPDAIIADIAVVTAEDKPMLPLLRCNKRLRNTPLILTSGESDYATFSLALKLGAREFVAKPVARAVLLSKVKQAITKAVGAIVVADDSDCIRGLLAKIVQRHGYAVLTAANGREALDLIKNNEVSLVISDIMMPEMNGLELLSAVKRDRPDVRVLLVTGKKGEQTKVEAIGSGADGYITKPFKNYEITHLISTILGS
ncbi:MAG: response regulator [candidate division Zixibacteria bacterium]|nr:response regulator [candidate division Zixibacteria bacterium]